MTTKSTVDQLNRILRGEIAAVETYRMLLDSFDATSPARVELEDCLTSHEERVEALREAVALLGGAPSCSSGAWGVFARTVVSTARAFGDTSAIAALRQGEADGFCDYFDNLTDAELDTETRSVVSTRLLPAQHATHERISALVHRMRWSPPVAAVTD